jgi:protein-S-isoprenylcysteine O-methyltransferase Ste14
MVLLHFIFPIYKFIENYWKLIGIATFLSGILLNLLADRSIKKNKTTVKPGEDSEVLIKNGVFRISRNPMYLGMSLIHLGIGIFLGSISPFLVIPVFIYLVEKRFIALEEQKLEEKFGIEWNNYKKFVRKWI